MRTTVLLLALCAAAGLALGARDFRPPPTPPQDEAGKKYSTAFEQGVQDKERAAILEDVVKHYVDSPWADDALWALAQMADGEGDYKKAVEFRSKLLERKKPPELEPFTWELPVCLQSRAPSAMRLLDATGSRYAAGKGGKVLEFNPIPMLTHEEIALNYIELGQEENALQQYREALAATPQESLFADIYRRRISRLEEKISARKSADQSKETGKAGAAGQADGEQKQAPPAPKDEQKQEGHAKRGEQ